MTAAFAAALRYILQNEGTHYTDAPHDRGGPTRYGITLRAWCDYLGRAQTAHDLKALQLSDAERFYRDVYWEPLGAEALCAAGAAAQALILCDCAVLHGARTAVTLTQRSLKVRVDGLLGPQTNQALVQSDAAAFACNMLRHAVLRYVDIARLDVTQLVFLRGWVLRSWRWVDVANALSGGKVLDTSVSI